MGEMSCKVSVGLNWRLLLSLEDTGFQGKHFTTVYGHKELWQLPTGSYDRALITSSWNN